MLFRIAPRFVCDVLCLVDGDDSWKGDGPCLEEGRGGSLYGGGVIVLQVPGVLCSESGVALDGLGGCVVVPDDLGC